MSNIFEPISDEAYKQIEVRQTKISGSFRDNETIAWLNSNGAFVRLKSSVDVDSPELRTQLGYSNDQPWEIASKYTLEGGIRNGFTDASSNKGNPHSGILSETNENAAYGFEGPSITGIKPMPGIEKASIKTVGEGYLREATIDIRVNSIEQLNILEVLYFRLGYSVLLEWGHSSYFNNDKTFEGNPIINEIGFSDLTELELAKKIQENRKNSSYNYDALHGVITNFQWNFRDDGGYDVTLQVISKGEIINSLLSKNSQDNTKLEFEIQNNKYLVKGGKSVTTSVLKSIQIASIHRYYTNLQNSPTISTPKYGVVGLSQKLDANLMEIKNELIYLNDKSNPLGYNVSFFPTGVQGGNVSYSPYYGVTESLVNNLLGNQPKSPQKFKSQTLKPEDLKEILNSSETGIYIKFSEFLDLLNATSLLPTSPLKIESDPDSVDMLISQKHTIPVNPEICLFYWNSFGSSFNRKLNILRKRTDAKFHDTQYGPYIGKLLRIHLNISFLIKVLNNNTSNGVIDLKKTMTEVLNKINEVTGEVNNFQFIKDETTENFKIINLFNNPIKFNSDNLKSKQLEIFGNKTLFHSINLSSELTSDLASIASISAQGKDDSVIDIFSYFKNGIKDRIANLSISSSPQDIQENKTQLIKNVFFDLELHAEYLYTTRFINVLQDNNENLSSLLTFSQATDSLKTLLKAYFNQDNKTRGNTILIPVNLSFTMQGFSGFKLFNEFVIPTDFLPNLYKTSDGEDPRFKFIIKGINHEISLNKWETSIETFMGPIPYPSSPSNNNNNPPPPPPPPPPVPPRTLSYITNTPWSAVFISFIIQEAANKLALNLPFYPSLLIKGAAHTQYANAAIISSTWEVLDPKTTKIQLGDIIIKNRAGNNQTYKPNGGYSGPSHGDIVTSITSTSATLIGGNIIDDIGTTTTNINPQGILRDSDYFAIVRPNIPSGNPITTQDFANELVNVVSQEFKNWGGYNELDPIFIPRLKQYYLAGNLQVP